MIEMKDLWGNTGIKQYKSPPGQTSNPLVLCLVSVGFLSSFAIWNTAHSLVRVLSSLWSSPWQMFQGIGISRTLRFPGKSMFNFYSFVKWFNKVFMQELLYHVSDPEVPFEIWHVKVCIYIFRKIISSWFTVSLIRIECPIFTSSDYLRLVSTLSDMRMAMSACILILYDQVFFFISFTLRL